MIFHFYTHQYWYEFKLFHAIHIPWQQTKIGTIIQVYNCPFVLYAFSWKLFITKKKSYNQWILFVFFVLAHICLKATYDGNIFWCHPQSRQRKPTNRIQHRKRIESRKNWKSHFHSLLTTITIRKISYTWN